MNAATLDQGIASGVYKVTKLAPRKPRRSDLIMTRVAAGKSFAAPSYRSVRESTRNARGSKASVK
jgi:hypothetical protein